jgi:hypothetical protein
VIGSGRSALGSIKASAASPLNTPAVHVHAADIDVAQISIKRELSPNFGDGLKDQAAA